PSVSQDDDNPDIDTETYTTYEAGLRGITMFGIHYEASVFLTDTKDIISKVDGTYNWDSEYYDNVGDSRNTGFELSLKGKVKDRFTYNIAYTYLDTYYTSHKPFVVQLENHDETYDIKDNELPRVPHNKINILTTYKLTPNIKLFGEFYAQSKYYADETNLVKMPGYAKVNLKVSYTPIKDLEFFIKLDNALDKQYYRTVYLFSDKNGDDKLDAEDASIVVDPGRVWYAGLRYKF
ncbi:MAG: TonB-dependent receptor, partial [Epsilonproteobacteria bacterium]|nr:TonB-dependent receptor [Campylobacterota bacterium]